VLIKQVRGDRGGQARCLTYHSRNLENWCSAIKDGIGAAKSDTSVDMSRTYPDEILWNLMLSEGGITDCRSNLDRLCRDSVTLVALAPRLLWTSHLDGSSELRRRQARMRRQTVVVVLPEQGVSWINLQSQRCQGSGATLPEPANGLSRIQHGHRTTRRAKNTVHQV
jgi:hypothetical protein